MGEPDRCRERPAPSPLPAQSLSWTQGQEGTRAAHPAGTLDQGQPVVQDPHPTACLGRLAAVLLWCARWCRPGLGAKRWHVSRREKAAQIRPSSLSLMAARPVPSAPPLTPGPSGWLRLWRELRPLSRLGWHRGRPSCSPRPTPPAGPEHLPPAPPAGPRSRLLPRGARQLSRAPRGPRQAGNLLLFVECFCHANPRAGRWR